MKDGLKHYCHTALCENEWCCIIEKQSVERPNSMLKTILKSKAVSNAFFYFALVAILFTRLISETVNTFVWDKANHIWAVGMILIIGFILFPCLILMTRRENNIIKDYKPVLIYLVWIAMRVDPSDMYSVKCFLAEAICWFLFVFTREVCQRDPVAAKSFQRLVDVIIKSIIIFGLLQLAVYIITTSGFRIDVILENRPVKGIFVHQSICLIMLFPFSFCFLKRKEYAWFFAVLLASLFTGSRSAFLAFVVLGWLTFRMLMDRPIRKIDIFITVLIICIIYGTIILQNSDGWHWENVDSRFTWGTLQWRVDFWKKFLENMNGLPLIFGHGVGNADMLFGSQFEEGTFPPHNDYIRIFYDTGFIGLLIYLMLVVFMIKKLMQAQVSESGVIVNAYLTVLIFSLTDNFLYHTNTILLYMYLAGFSSEKTNYRISDIARTGNSAQEKEI